MIRQFRIRQFKESDGSTLVHLFEDFQDYIASTDYLRKLARKDKLAKSRYGIIYLKNTMKQIRKNRAFLCWRGQ